MWMATTWPLSMPSAIVTDIRGQQMPQQSAKELMVYGPEGKQAQLKPHVLSATPCCGKRPVTTVRTDTDNRFLKGTSDVQPRQTCMKHKHSSVGGSVAPQRGTAATSTKTGQRMIWSGKYNSFYKPVEHPNICDSKKDRQIKTLTRYGYQC